MDRDNQSGVVEFIKRLDPALKREVGILYPRVDPLGHCLLCASAARDVLRKARFDAALLFVQMNISVPDNPDVLPVTCGEEGRDQFSSASGPFHCVVIAGGWLYDATYLQAWRPRFGDAPGQFILMNVPPELLQSDSAQSFGGEFGFTRILYSAHSDQTRFLSAPDASRNRRRPIVSRVCKRLRL